MSFLCPHCGAQVPDKRISCQECGSDFQTGWNPHENYTGDPVIDDVDYEDLLAKEFPNEFGPSKKKNLKDFLKWMIAGLVALSMLAAYGVFNF